jgi:hypothetical protein
VTTRGIGVRRLAALALTAVLLVAGCGDETAPGDAAPELADQLTRIDRAVAAGDEAVIRQRVESLVAATEAARDAGRIDDAQADRILTAADELQDRLPAEQPEPKPSPSSPSTSAPPPAPEPDEDEDDHEDDGDQKKPPKHEKRKGGHEEKPPKGKGHGKH